MLVLFSVPFFCISQNDIQILIVMIVNTDNTCDQCALDALHHFIERQFYHEAHV